MKTSKNTVLKITALRTAEPVRFVITSEKEIKKCLWKISDTFGKVMSEGNVISDRNGVSGGNVTSDGKVMSEGNVTSEGNGVSGGNFTSDGSVMSEGNITSEGNGVSDGNVTSDGSVMSEGNITSEGNGVSGGNVTSDGNVISEGNVTSEENVTADKNVVSAEASFDALPWSVEKPNLYVLDAVLTFADGETETLSDRFGFRYFGHDEKYIYLNGYPLYLRAYIRGAAAHEHKDNCGLGDYEFYKKNITMAKSYGFNAIRFHSVIPPEECFRAADELGMLIHIEMRAEEQEYDNIYEMLYGKNDFVSDAELSVIIDRLYDHPSFMVYCVGNEIREPGKKPRIREISEFIKKKDPTRLFIDTCAHGEYDRDYVDIDVQHMSYFFPYGKHADMFENTDYLLCFGTVGNKDMVAENGGGKISRKIAFSRPLIAHEVCHYTSWRDFYALKEKFARYGVTAPWWVDEEIKMIEAKGYAENYRDTLQVTKDNQFRCWKTAFEAIRSSDLLAGFHMLQFADTDKYENSNGIVDCFDDPHGISAADFRKFNADTVVLARLPERIYQKGDTVRFPVLLSQFRIDPQKTATFRYNVTDGSGKSLFSGSLGEVDTGNSGVYCICSVGFDIPEDAETGRLNVSCALEFDDGEVVQNDWNIWVFPKAEKTSLPARDGMKARYLEPAFGFTGEKDVLVTDNLGETLFETLGRGGDAVLIYRTDWTRHLLHKDMPAPEYAFRAVWERFKGVIWDRGTFNGGTDDKDILESTALRPTDR